MTSTALAIPETAELAREFPSDLLYKLERAGEISGQILDERVIEWAAEGWPQRAIADELGCTRQAIGKRMQRLGVEPAHPEKRKRKRMSNPVAHAEEMPEIENVTDLDPRTEAICPTCHGSGLVRASGEEE